MRRTNIPSFNPALGKGFLLRQSQHVADLPAEKLLVRSAHPEPSLASALQFEAAKQLGIRSNNDGRKTHCYRAHAHGEVEPGPDEKTSRNGNGDQVIRCRPDEILDHLPVGRA